MAIPRPVFRALPRCPGAVTGRPGRAVKPAGCLYQACSLLGTRTYPSHASALKRYRGLCSVRMGPVARGVHAWVRQAQGASTWPRYVLTGSRAGPTPAGMEFNRPRTKSYSVAALSGSTIRCFCAVRHVDPIRWSRPPPLGLAARAGAGNTSASREWLVAPRQSRAYGSSSHSGVPALPGGSISW